MNQWVWFITLNSNITKMLVSWEQHFNQYVGNLRSSFQTFMIYLKNMKAARHQAIFILLQVSTSRGNVKSSLWFYFWHQMSMSSFHVQKGTENPKAKRIKVNVEWVWKDQKRWSIALRIIKDLSCMCKDIGHLNSHEILMLFVFQKIPKNDVGTRSLIALIDQLNEYNKALLTHSIVWWLFEDQH